MAISQYPHKKSLGSSSLQSIFCSVKNSRPNSWFLLKATFAFFPNMPFLYLGQMSQWATKSSVSTGSFGDFPSLKPTAICSPYWRSLFGMKMLSFHNWGKVALGKLGHSETDGNLTNSTNWETGNFPYAKYILLRERTPSPMCVWFRLEPPNFSNLDLSYT